MAAVSPKQKITLAVLGIVLVIVWTRALTSKPVYRRTPAPPAYRSLAVNAPVSGTPAAEKPPVLKWKRDPFAVSGTLPAGSAPSATAQTSVVSPQSTGPFRLEGIIWNPRKPVAVINGTMVEVGSSISGWKVIEIQENRVIVSDGQTTKTIEL